MSQDQPSSTYSPGVLVGLVLTCAAASLILIFVAPGKVMNVGYIIGQQLVWSLVVWALFRFTVQAHAEEKHGALTYLILFLTMAFSGVAGAQRYDTRLKEQLRAASPSIREAMRTAIKDLNSNGTQTIDATPRASGDVGKMEQFLKNSLKSLLETRTAYGQELKAAGQDELMSLAGIDKPGDLERRQAIARDLMVISDRFRTTYLAKMEAIRASIPSLDMDPDMRAGILKGFDAKFDRAKLSEQLGLDHEIFQSASRQIGILLKSRGQWRLVGGKLQFRRPQDLMAWNAEVRTIQDLSAREKRIQESGIKQAEGSMDLMDKAAR